VTRIAIIFLVFTFSAQAQKTSWDIEATPLWGALLPHHDDMLYLRESHIKGGEISLTKRTDGSKDWHHRYYFPRWGFSLTGYDLGSQYMGLGFGGRIFFDLPITESRKLFLKLSFGAGWIEKPFDLDENVRNSAIGSHLNASLGVALHYHIPLSERWILSPGIGIDHYSNGAMQMPNSGINLALVRMALLYRFNPQPLPTLEKAPYEPEKFRIIMGASGGMKETKPIGGRKYGILNLFGIYLKRVSGKSSIGGELGINYNESLQYANDEADRDNPDSRDNYRPYIAGIYQLHFDPLVLRFSLGSYIAPRYTGDGLIFLRYHLVYDLNRFQFFAGLKSHYARADNGEIGIAYKLK
jgi:hypothetical protein